MEAGVNILLLLPSSGWNIPTSALHFSKMTSLLIEGTRLCRRLQSSDNKRFHQRWSDVRLMLPWQHVWERKGHGCSDVELLFHSETRPMCVLLSWETLKQELCSFHQIFLCKTWCKGLHPPLNSKHLVYSIQLRETIEAFDKCWKGKLPPCWRGSYRFVPTKTHLHVAFRAFSRTASCWCFPAGTSRRKPDETQQTDPVFAHFLSMNLPEMQAQQSRTAE